MAEAMTLKEALRVLEITNLNTLSLGDLQVIRRRAQKRWHPDTIASMRPDKETLERYESNFRAIDAAVEAVAAYIERGAPQADVNRPPQPDEPEEVIRRNAASMQEKLREQWQSVRKSAALQPEVIFEGWAVKDLLKQDLDDGIPALVLAGWIGGILPMAILSSVILDHASRSGAEQMLAPIVTLVLVAFTTLCMCMIMPMARFWLPPQLASVGLTAVNVGLWFFRAMHKLMVWSARFGPIFFWAYWAFWLTVVMPVLLMRLGQFIVLRPLYFLVGEILVGRRIGVTRQKGRYWHGIKETEVDMLLFASLTSLTRNDLFKLSGLYSAAIQS